MTQIVYNAEPTLSQFHASNAFIRGVMGPVGSGKSAGCCNEIIYRAITQKAHNEGKEKIRRSRWGVIRNTYSELKTTTIRTWLDWMPAACNKMKYDAPITSHCSFALGDGTRVELEVLFVSLDRPDDIDKLQSMELTGLWLNEACHLPKAVLDMGASRVGRFPAKKDGGSSWCGVIMDTNPMDTDHWYYFLAEQDTTTEHGRKIMEDLRAAEQVMREEGLLEEDQPLMEFFRQPPALVYKEKKWVPNRETAENIDNLQDGWAYYLRQVAGKNFEWINTFLGANYGRVVDGKPVYPEYCEHNHYKKEHLKPIPGLPIIAGTDFGRTPAVAFCQCTSRGKMRVLGELCSEDMGIQTFLNDAVKPYVAQYFPDNEVVFWGDPAGKTKEGNEKTAADYIEEAGFHCEFPSTNAPLARREAVVYFLTRLSDGSPSFEMDFSCQMLRKGFAGGYHYKRVQVSGDERFKDEPDKNKYSHIHDALQYACLAVGGAGAARRMKDEKPEWAKRISRPQSNFMAR